ncbi:sigma-70 family RNA polymerase sigma factor [Ktedonosporobacter rubrisoli]|uniref:Sigma-70 family RNA polymerase sigma factor n=1 Tax=Ktedonosporobacter rubrisoli TaxID=2509675 RepID=A0A4P6JMY3_KTERU|nr:bifunctional nuclease domain-containing protein [Ktedonosporobacter rubrisoli]QBD76430.1 sigma-70 family RNA polymerase sigma factor [Ktedonosporobacter rubrisoli]
MKEKLDAELVSLARVGDKQAFHELIERYQVMAMCLGLRFCGEQETARELVQEAILQAYLSLDQLQHEERFKNWFYGIVLNVCRNWRRTSRQDQFVSLDGLANSRSFESSLLENANSLYIDPQEIIEAQELRKLVEQAMNMLSLNKRQVAHLFYYEDLSIQEIAHLLNISPMAAKSRLHKGREQLRAYLQSLLPDYARKAIEHRKATKMVPVKVARVLRGPSGTNMILLDERNLRALLLKFPRPLNMNLLQRMHISAQADAIKEPSTTDLMAELLNTLGGELQKVAIDALEGYILYAQLHLRLAQEQQSINAHLHDALPLALHLHCPFVVSEEVFKQKGVKLKKKGATLEQQLDAMLEQNSNAAHLPGHKTSGKLEFAQGLVGWTISGDRKYFNYHLDRNTSYTGKLSLAINQQGTEHKGFIQLKHEDIAADPYRGKHMRFIAFLKAEEVKTAGFVLSVEAPPLDPEENFPAIYTTRSPKPIKGTYDWTRHELVIDVPDRAIAIRLIFSMWRKGKVWLDGLSLEIVDGNVPLTGTKLLLQRYPLNLDFSQGLNFWTFSQQEQLWVLHVEARQDYQCGVEQSAEGTHIAFIKAAVEQPQKKVTLEQTIFPKRDYVGKRLRFSASIKTADVGGQASLFLRMSPGWGFGRLPPDELAEQIIQGTTDWTRYEVEVDVSKRRGATVSFGFSLHGQGQVWVKDMQVGTVEMKKGKEREGE